MTYNLNAALNIVFLFCGTTAQNTHVQWKLAARVHACWNTNRSERKNHRTLQLMRFLGLINQTWGEEDVWRSGGTLACTLILTPNTGELLALRSDRFTSWKERPVFTIKEAGWVPEVEKKSCTYRESNPDSLVVKHVSNCAVLIINEYKLCERSVRNYLHPSLPSLQNRCTPLPPFTHSQTRYMHLIIK
jgi:hypothetical protein